MKVKKIFFPAITIALFGVLFSCSNDTFTLEPISEPNAKVSALSVSKNASLLAAYFGDNIDFSNLPNYANQSIPMYVFRNNTPFINRITDEGATLGRVLFYDKNLSSNNKVSCSSCHKQELAFGDNNRASQGVNGNTGRHSMRLINVRFAEEFRVFWDKRATSLDTQTTIPIRDHIEMGYSGKKGAPSFDHLIKKLQGLDYYQELFTRAFGSAEITEEKIQKALAQFVSSIISFDSKYDEGRAEISSEFLDFPNFTPEENLGKKLYMEFPVAVGGTRAGGGMGCASCHFAPEFGMTALSGNNGVIDKIGSTEKDLSVTNSPSMRDLVNSNGQPHAPMMHSAVFSTLEQVIDHYNNIPKEARTDKLDNNLRLRSLNATPEEKKAIIAFMKTLTGKNVYKDRKWSNPFINP
ncbi:cytochrome-c peroxidase [Chryseobacterium lactis]|uniref:Cytochrome-c peroxidase n=1 Tax=Chryseobacterium lactis TaxID=1241981 RepID=A0A3G6RMB4_CHRLC|nr:cytochrome c peroxidase [Chryseobacterium lactis]AZA83933.1 cytochrome-c peroxidase [Chryseobacterium lactis]AZB04319.1 cytochrome-c peroxidase [Chryseobacterium lactis]PNW12769.1 cytochrome-c peroxidase [Chryseobacterium lactis]